jgi:hypothetical protein
MFSASVFLPKPDADEDVARPDVAECRAQRLRIEQVGCDQYDAVNAGWRTPRQPVDLPSAADEMPGKAAADNSAGPNHKRRFCDDDRSPKHNKPAAKAAGDRSTFDAMRWRA